MAKVTEKQLKARVTELNLGDLKSTSFGLRLDRGSKGYSVSIVYRDSTPEEVILVEGTAAEASAAVDGVAATQKVFRQSMLGSTVKPKFLTDELFIKKSGERCPRTSCGSRDLLAGWVERTSDGIKQAYRCTKCGLNYDIKYQMVGYEVVTESKEHAKKES